MVLESGVLDLETYEGISILAVRFKPNDSDNLAVLVLPFPRIYRRTTYDLSIYYSSCINQVLITKGF